MQLFSKISILPSLFPLVLSLSFSIFSNLCDHNPPTVQTDKIDDVQSLDRAVHYSALRGKNWSNSWELEMLWLFQEDLSQLVNIERSLAIFVMATYGEGDPTDNAQEFYDWLQDGTTQLDGLRYAVCVSK